MGSIFLEGEDEPEHDPDDPDAPAVLPRKPKASLLKKMASEAPKASSSLDDFITKANEGLLDVRSDPTPTPASSREKELQAKLDELEKKLASAEARAKKAEAQRAVAAEPVMPMAPPSRGVGGIVVAFVLGVGAMFAVSTFVLKKEPEKTASVPATTPPETATAPTPTPTETPTPAPPPVVTPIEQTAAVPTPTPTPSPTPVPVAETKVAAKKQGGTKHTGGTRETNSTTTDPQPAKQPDPAHSGSNDLYNPF